MDTQTVATRRVAYSMEELDADIERADNIAQLMDAKFGLGSFRFGLDTLVGLIPVVGDTVITLVGVYPILVAKKHGLGAVPTQIFDAGVVGESAEQVERRSNHDRARIGDVLDVLRCAVEESVRL